jgi:hypothetical protein
MKVHKMLPMDGRLFVDFCGEERVLAPGMSMSFGRAGDLVIDTNMYLHRLLGRFIERDGVWWLDNLGSRTPVVVRDANGPSSAIVSAGGSHALTHGEFVVSFSAGPSHYEVLGALEEHEWALDLLGPEGLSGERTHEWGHVELNSDQRLLLVVLCEARLLDPSATDAPIVPNRQGAIRLGWSLSKFNRKLDHLCEKLHRAGVAGVHGGVGETATDRRRRLVEHSLEAQLVLPGDLRMLDGSPAA